VSSYGQFCPVAKASEIICQRWTPLVVRELMCGSRRFGEIQRGVPLMSPSLLSQRLRELGRAGVVRRADDGGYDLTEAGLEFHGIVRSLGEWGQRWARSDYGRDELDPGLLLWDMRRHLRPGGLGVERCVIEFRFPRQAPGRRRYWMVDNTDGVDVCLTDPGFPVDVVVSANLEALTKIWMGDASFAHELERRRVDIDGPSRLVQRIPDWLGQHPVLASIRPAARAG
jgi:DNA-binding HxlR family transcriptional regulator